MLNTIKNVEPSGRLHGKVFPGEKLLTINGHTIEDVLDYKYYSYEPKLTLEVESKEGKVRRIRVKKQEGEPLGLDFEIYLMDEARGCSNHCLFCFIDQLPKGLRKTLYFKDDDARLSFLTGNYITLTNLSEREVDRICALRVSPLNISVHTTDPELRVKMLRNPKAAGILPLLQRFAAAGITMDCQIVCCPGINDGEALQKTMDDLAALYPHVNSVSIVPVGLTKHRDHLPKLTPFNAETAAATIDHVESFAKKCDEVYGSKIFWCSDELYLKALRDVPGDEYYEDYSQLENGVGLIRLLKTDFEYALEDAEETQTHTPFAIVTGVAASPLMCELIEKAKKRFPEIDGEVYTINNDFFGHTIDVAGLITGQDIIAQLKDKHIRGRLLIPSVMVRSGEGIFLDDVTLKDVEDVVGVPVQPVDNNGAKLLEAMLA